MVGVALRSTCLWRVDAPWLWVMAVKENKKKRRVDVQSFRVSRSVERCLALDLLLLPASRTCSWKAVFARTRG